LVLLSYSLAFYALLFGWRAGQPPTFKTKKTSIF